MFRGIPWQEICKFLAGAFFVNAGVLFYLYLAGVSVPLLGTRFIETPEISGGRSVIQAVLFLSFFYLGFIRKWNNRSRDAYSVLPIGFIRSDLKHRNEALVKVRREHPMPGLTSALLLWRQCQTSLRDKNS